MYRCARRLPKRTLRERPSGHARPRATTPLRPIPPARGIFVPAASRPYARFRPSLDGKEGVSGSSENGFAHCDAPDADRPRATRSAGRTAVPNRLRRRLHDPPHLARRLSVGRRPGPHSLANAAAATVSRLAVPAPGFPHERFCSSGARDARAAPSRSRACERRSERHPGHQSGSDDKTAKRNTSLPRGVAELGTDQLRDAKHVCEDVC